MNKFNVYVPFDGNRDAVVNYFSSNGVKYLFDINAHISLLTAPVDATESEVEEIAGSTAENLVIAYDQDPRFGKGEVYEFTDDNGEQLGWEVTFYTYANDF